MEFVARPLLQRWAGKLQPLLAINSSRLVLAAGNTIHSYAFGSSPGPEQSSAVKLECTYTTSAFHPNHDITGLVSVPDGGHNGTMYLGYADGSLERITLPACHKFPDSSVVLDASLRERYDFHEGSLIESLSASSTHVLSLSSEGTAVFLPFDSVDPSPEIIHLNTRSWSSYLSTHSSAPYAAFGTSSTSPLSVHTIDTSHIAAHPSAFLAPSFKPEGASAVYAITSAPPTSPWGGSDQIIVSGWYDGIVRVHDLRSSRRTISESSTPSLLPTMTFADPWSFEPIYSLACGGGSASHIAAGSARHSVVAFWDIRASRKGWSVHAPGNDSSPVYSLIVDGSRVFGANESRGFVIDFGEGVTDATYPPIAVLEAAPQTRRGRGAWSLPIEGPKKGSPGFYVTTYKHQNSG
ncbi:hypothetical protein PHLCEN_2v13574 [Hermanssonia centrifuga]|uniref:Uncharacterized protein n=1 Tax=Hermanssonia centrifuga TaxID=98765 RepID=A0A2R6NDU9_9APHY|nr:hypothetical protein PHLCEN_2v13574 [Hermanssonia centrifuga]